MSEEQQNYTTELQDALEMLGVGYDKNEPSLVIEKPQTKIALRDSGLEEYKVWGWVKKSTKFLYHLKILKGAKHAILDCICLTINEDGECDLSITDIANITGYSRSEVIQSLKEMSEMGYLAIKKQSGMGNIYKPLFAARGSKTPADEPVHIVNWFTPVDGYPSSPSEGISVPTFKELKELIQKEIKMNTEKSPWDIADGVYKHLLSKGLKITGKQKQEIREYLSSLDDGSPIQEKTKKGKKGDMHADIKTIARARGISEEKIVFIERMCKAFNFSIMQLDEISLGAYDWIIQQEEKGQTIEKFVAWARSEENQEGKFINQYRNNGGSIKNDWPRAFKVQEDRTSLIKRVT